MTQPALDDGSAKLSMELASQVLPTFYADVQLHVAYNLAILAARLSVLHPIPHG